MFSLLLLGFIKAFGGQRGRRTAQFKHLNKVITGKERKAFIYKFVKFVNRTFQLQTT